MGFQRFYMFTYIIQYLALAAGYGYQHQHCKAVPGSKDWPRQEQWNILNRTLSGHLIKVIPPGGVCHPTYPSFDPIACPLVAAAWNTNNFHAADPVSSMQNNWNNDTCLPIPTFPCSGKGYPVYVINATKPEHVKKGVDFARKHNVRLIVKGTGHDYLGRSSAPYSLSIWTHNMKGLQFHDKGKFKPSRCRKARIDTAAITVAAGVPMLELDEQANLRKLVIVSGGAGTVGIGGYLTGGGHGAISPIFGLGADQVLEMEIVTPMGEIITANECEHSDIFWAMRGGGGSTFGVLTSATIKAFPSFKFANAIAFLGSPLTATDQYWEAISTIVSQYPALTDQGISAYSFIAPNRTGSDWGIPFPVDGYFGTFNLPLIYPENTTDSLVAAVESAISSATAPFPPGIFYTSVTGREFPDFWTFYKDNNGPQDGGSDNILASRLLDREALTGNKTALREALKKVTRSEALTANLVGGKGVHNAKIPGGGNAVNPAWRKAHLHAISGTTIPKFASLSQKHALQALNTQTMQALRDIAPDSGAYVNEADPHEPNFQKSFWGKNYGRLLQIKRRVDPGDVLWCEPCVGNERWRVVEEDGRLCRL